MQRKPPGYAAAWAHSQRKAGIGLKWAKKREDRQIRAWELGAGSPMERKLLREGRMVLRADGRYELFSQEAVSGSGELAERGDYFKVDGTGAPYPNRRERFLSTHSRVQGDVYVQQSCPVQVWMAGDPETEAVRWLLETGRLTLHPEDPEHYFQALLWGARLSAAQDAVLVLYQRSRDEQGRLRDVEFNFVAASEFQRDYILL